MAGKRKRSDHATARSLKGASSHIRRKTSKQVTEKHDQQQSLLFRLPREIRDIIYGYILAAPVTIHLAYVGTKSTKFRSFLCRISEEFQPERTQSGDLCPRCKIVHYTCSPRVNTKSWDVKSTRTYEDKKSARVMALLRSCRRVYEETINTLYQLNTFYIENPRTLLELPNYMPQERLSAFRNLYLESPWYGDDSPPNRLQRWEEVIAVLPKLDGLKSLCVIMRPMCGLTWEREGLMNPLVKIDLPFLRTITARIVNMSFNKDNLCERHQRPQRVLPSAG